MLNVWRTIRNVFLPITGSRIVTSKLVSPGLSKVQQKWRFVTKLLLICCKNNLISFYCFQLLVSPNFSCRIRIKILIKSKILNLMPVLYYLMFSISEKIDLSWKQRYIDKGIIRVKARRLSRMLFSAFICMEMYLKLHLLLHIQRLFVRFTLDKTVFVWIALGLIRNQNSNGILFNGPISHTINKNINLNLHRYRRVSVLKGIPQYLLS